MPTFEDTFAGPALESKWIVSEVGSVSYTVSNGFYANTVDNVGDSVICSTNTTMASVVQGGQPFQTQILFNEIFPDPTVTVVGFLGWRSLTEYAGAPRFGVDVMVKIAPVAVGTQQYEQRVIDTGASSRSILGDVEDYYSGFDGTGGFLLERVADGDFVLSSLGEGALNPQELSRVTLPKAAQALEGYIHFGLFAEP